MKTDEKMFKAGRRFLGIGFAQTRQRQSSSKLLSLFVLLGFLLSTGCAVSNVSSSPNHKDIATKICAAIQNLKTNATVDPNLKKDLAEITMERFIEDEDGRSFRFGGVWHYDYQRGVLVNQGYWLGLEHTWYEIAFSNQNSIGLHDISRLREVRRR